MTRARARATAALAASALTAAGALAGCGGHSSLSDRDLRADAARTCAIARLRTDRVRTPASPSGGEAFLRRGVAVLGPELAELRTLSPSTALASKYRAAIADLAAEVAMIRSTMSELRAGADPLIRFPELERSLAPAEARANAAWQALDIGACTER
jgi:hypothetical protein